MHTRNRGMIIAFLTPALLFFSLIFLYPIFRTGLMSFFNVENVTSGMDTWTFVSLGNYFKLADTSLFRISN